MSKVVKKLRYGHLAGGTDIVYTVDGKYVVTCGADCHVRVHEIDSEKSSSANDGARQVSTSVMNRSTCILVSNTCFYNGLVRPI